MSLKRPFVPKSDVKQLFTTTTVQRRPSVFDVDQTLYDCYTTFSCSLDGDLYYVLEPPNLLNVNKKAGGMPLDPLVAQLLPTL